MKQQNCHNQSVPLCFGDSLASEIPRQARDDKNGELLFSEIHRQARDDKNGELWFSEIPQQARDDKIRSRDDKKTEIYYYTKPVGQPGGQK